MKWFVAMLLCMVMVGCAAEPEPKPKYRRGQMIELRTGRRGQIIRRWQGIGGAHYNVRIESGRLLVDLNEFELTIIKE